MIHKLVALNAALGPAELEEGPHWPVANAAPESNHAAVSAQHRVQRPGGQTHRGWVLDDWCSQAGLSAAGCLPSDLARKRVAAEPRASFFIDRQAKQLTPVRGGSGPLTRRWRRAMRCEEAAGIGIAGEVLSSWHKPSSRTRLVELPFADCLPQTLAVRRPPQSVADAGAVRDVVRPQTQQDSLHCIRWETEQQG